MSASSPYERNLEVRKEKSTEAWKKKAIYRGTDLRECRKKINRLLIKIEKQEYTIKNLDLEKDNLNRNYQVLFEETQQKDIIIQETNDLLRKKEEEIKEKDSLLLEKNTIITLNSEKLVDFEEKISQKDQIITEERLRFNNDIKELKATNLETEKSLVELRLINEKKSQMKT